MNQIDYESGILYMDFTNFFLAAADDAKKKLVILSRVKNWNLSRT